MTRKPAPAYAPLFPYLAAAARSSILAPNELVIDNFAGLGGASTGLEQALGRPVDVAINHSRTAVELHSINHPYTTHYTEDVWQVDPREVTKGQRVKLAWFSPTCTHFSKAKGGGLLDRKIRGLAWVKLRWLDLTLPDIAITENVEEFQGWCDLGPDGRPKPGEKGRTFRVWVNAMRRLGYEVEWRELRACDYGAPTIRKRLFVIARRDGLPIVWPEPTHGKPTDPRVLNGDLKPWRTAAECIDWTLPTPSIFARKKPLVAATLRRIARGIERFVLEAEEPFIVRTDMHQSNSACVYDSNAPLTTITTAQGHGLVMPTLLNKQHQAPARAVTDPLSTITTNHNKNELLTAHLTKFNTGSVGQGLSEPITTIVAGGTPARESTGNTHGLVTAHLVQHNGGKLPPKDASYPVDRPTRTVMAQGGRQDLVSGALIACGGRGAQARPKAIDEVMHTVTSKADMCLTTVHLSAYYSQNGKGDAGQEATEPLRTVPTVDRFGVTAATLMRQFGTSTAADVAAPLGTIVAQGQGKTHLVAADCQPHLNAEQLARARQVYALLAEYAPDALARHADHEQQLVVLQVRGEWYVLADIGMRMLSPRELARCQGFPDDFKLDSTLDGKPLSKAAQVRGIGNSVCPPIARAVAHAQLTAQPIQHAAD